MSQYTQDTGPYNTGVANPYQFPVYAWVKGDPAVKLVLLPIARPLRRQRRARPADAALPHSPSTRSPC